MHETHELLGGGRAGGGGEEDNSKGGDVHSKLASGSPGGTEV